jgi:hypothetical protein
MSANDSVTMRLTALSAALALSSLSFVAAADSAVAPPVLRGTVTGISANTVMITKADGTSVTMPLAPTVSFATVEPRRFEQIKPTDYVGVTSVPGPNGTLTAQEIHILPKGLDEGSFPWDHAPAVQKGDAGSNTTTGRVSDVRNDSSAQYTMTNASVTAASPLSLKLSYQGSGAVGGKCVGLARDPHGTPCTGVVTIDVPPWTPVEAVVPAKAGDARVGLAVFARIGFDAKNRPIVLALILEKNGLKPLF